MRTILSAALTGALLLTSVRAENLLENSSFELPKVTGRTPVAKGGNPAAIEEGTSWSSLVSDSVANGGKLFVGLTDEIAHEGKQSFFVDFEKLTALGSRAVLTSDLVPVKEGNVYRIGLWGRLDLQRPLSMDERRPFLRVSVEYFSADQERQVGDTDQRIQMIPGSLIPGKESKLLFFASKWMEYFTEVKAPTEAAFMKVVFTVQAPRTQGETDGTLFLDSATAQSLGTEGSSPAESASTPEGGESPSAVPAVPPPTGSPTP